MFDVRTFRVFSVSPGNLAVDRRAFQDVIDELNHSSGRPHRATQPPGTHAQFRRLDHAHRESETGRRARSANLGEDRHHELWPDFAEVGCVRHKARLEPIRATLPATCNPSRPPRGHPVRRSVRRRRLRQNRLLLAPLGKHQRQNRTLVRGCLGYDHGVTRSVSSLVGPVRRGGLDVHST